jgi:hypothetical protein
MLVFKTSAGLIKMSEQWFDYYLFSLKFKWILYKWRPFWCSFKTSLFEKQSQIWESVGMKNILLQSLRDFPKFILVVLRINFGEVLG